MANITKKPDKERKALCNQYLQMLAIEKIIKIKAVWADHKPRDAKFLQMLPPSPPTCAT